MTDPQQVIYAVGTPKRNEQNVNFALKALGPLIPPFPAPEPGWDEVKCASCGGEMYLPPSTRSLSSTISDVGAEHYHLCLVCYKIMLAVAERDNLNVQIVYDDGEVPQE